MHRVDWERTKGKLNLFQERINYWVIFKLSRHQQKVMRLIFINYLTKLQLFSVVDGQLQIHSQEERPKSLRERQTAFFCIKKSHKSLFYDVMSIVNKICTLFYICNLKYGSLSVHSYILSVKCFWRFFLFSFQDNFILTTIHGFMTLSNKIRNDKSSKIYFSFMSSALCHKNINKFKL